jgi:hypothetical protein
MKFQKRRQIQARYDADIIARPDRRSLRSVRWKIAGSSCDAGEFIIRKLRGAILVLILAFAFVGFASSSIAIEQLPDSASSENGNVTTSDGPDCDAGSGGSAVLANKSGNGALSDAQRHDSACAEQPGARGTNNAGGDPPAKGKRGAPRGSKPVNPGRRGGMLCFGYPGHPCL